MTDIDKIKYSGRTNYQNHHHYHLDHHQYQHVATISYFTEPDKPTAEGSKILVTVKDLDGNSKYLSSPSVTKTMKCNAMCDVIAKVDIAKLYNLNFFAN